MANYDATARSNYFRVKDEASFRKALEGVELTIVPGSRDDTTGDHFGRFCLLADNGDSSGWPLMRSLEEANRDGEYEENFDIAATVSRHLVDDEVAVFVEVGAEKARYVVGYAVAINNKGESRHLNLDDIYPLAKDLGQNVTRAMY